MTGCVDKETLAAFAGGDLAKDLTAATEAHLEKCRHCAAALRQLPIDDDLVKRLRALERGRAEFGPALSQLRDVERRASTTMFGAAGNR